MLGFQDVRKEGPKTALPLNVLLLHCRTARCSWKSFAEVLNRAPVPKTDMKRWALDGAGPRVEHVLVMQWASCAFRARSHKQSFDSDCSSYNSRFERGKVELGASLRCRFPRSGAIARDLVQCTLEAGVRLANGEVVCPGSSKPALNAKSNSFFNVPVRGVLDLPGCGFPS